MLRACKVRTGIPYECQDQLVLSRPGSVILGNQKWRRYGHRGWETLHYGRQSPPPPYYQYPKTRKVHIFMNLPKFITGRLHQMRAGKSYLKTQPSWHITYNSPISPKCEEEGETLHHILFNCPALNKSHFRHLANIQEDNF